MNSLRWLRWERGRQATGYDKMLLLGNGWLLPFDCYLLRFPTGSCVPPHRDPVHKCRHYRVNLILKKAVQGGEFVCNRCIISLPRIKFFRPDMELHSVEEVKVGTRYVLSIGWALPQEKQG